jgi:hypothetical protein
MERFTKMRSSPLKLLFLVLFISWGFSQEADLVLRNGTVWTVDESKPTAEAVAVKDGKFIYVGSDQDVVKYIREGVTEVIDLRGLFVTPGFNDNHVHFEWTGRIVFGLNLLDIHEEKKFVKKYVKCTTVSHPESGSLVANGQLTKLGMQGQLGKKDVKQKGTFLSRTGRWLILFPKIGQSLYNDSMATYFLQTPKG